ncbi:MAG: AbrB/MazE/SpoVT family DNA-binding domain-containing protein [Acidobacteriota bacterium]|nr:AbrB/MazE/SpoVT family DNA-binding domain-containing protein [Acidobacteriota bacterium]
MKASLVRIGNSRGVRIPKAFLQQAGLRDEIEIEVRESQVVICPANHPRAGWDESFATMAARGMTSSWIEPLLRNGMNRNGSGRPPL